MLSMLRNLAPQMPFRTFFFVVSLSLMEMVEAKQSVLCVNTDASSCTRPADTPYLRGASFTQVRTEKKARASGGAPAADTDEKSCGCVPQERVAAAPAAGAPAAGAPAAGAPAAGTDEKSCGCVPQEKAAPAHNGKPES
ncbi:unnamed protein product [Amoebophrya sp. A25]|nr:unnamed protein product [Amoebophrya sp. A25]|eukprot:GSA25T00008508001.1